MDAEHEASLGGESEVLAVHGAEVPVGEAALNESCGQLPVVGLGAESIHVLTTLVAVGLGEDEERVFVGV